MGNGRIRFLWPIALVLSTPVFGADFFPTEARRAAFLRALERVDRNYDEAEKAYTHLLKLEQARYVKVRKTFVRRKPRTFVSATARGHSAFEEHVARLMEIVGGNEALPGNGSPQE